MKLINRLLHTNELVGKVGEQLIASRLEWIDILGNKGKILQNVYVPKESGGTSEIDLLYITKIGIFVIESKNYSGWIFGTDTREKWTEVLYGGKDWFGRNTSEKHTFYNPIMQNSTHIRQLKNYLKTDIPMISLIVFSERCEFKELNISLEDVYVCQRNDCSYTVKHCLRNYEEVLSAEEIESIYEKLLPLTNVDKEVKEMHKQRASDIKNGLICPLCGRKLIVKTAKNGPNAGNQFLACPGFPKCKYIRNL